MSGEPPPQDPWAAPTSGEQPYAPQPYPPQPYPPPAPPQPSYGPPPPGYPSAYDVGYGYPTSVYPTSVPLEPPVAKRTDPVSVAALVCGCLLLAPFAFVLGIVGVVRTKRPDLGGRGLAIAGIVLGIVGGFLGVAVAASISFARSDVGHEILGLASGDTVYVGDLADGDCFQAPTDQAALVLTIDTVSCSLPHDLEVMVVDDARFGSTSDSAPYPGKDVVSDGADSTCEQAFEDFVGTAYNDSTLDFFTIFPSQETWEQEHDRAVICSVGDPDGQVTGTLKDAQR